MKKASTVRRGARPRSPSAPLFVIPVIVFLILVVVDLAIYVRVDRELLGLLTESRRRIEAIGDLRSDASLAYLDLLEWRLAPAEERADRAEEIDAKLGLVLGQIELLAATSGSDPAEVEAIARLRRAGAMLAERIQRFLEGHPAPGPDLRAGLSAVDAAAIDILVLNASAGAAADARVAALFDSRRALHAVLLGGVGLLIALGIMLQSRTERTRAQLAESERRRDDLSRMAASLAHEINNQLAVLENTAALLRRRHPSEELLRYGDESTEQIRALVASLRAFSDVSEGPRREVDVGELVEQLARAFDGVQVEVERPTLLRADGQALSRVVLNLLKNALEAGGPVAIAVGEQDGGVRLTVSDGGPGVSAEHAVRIGEPFFTTKARGTGLGLAIVREFAARNDGRFKLRNRPEGGAIAELWLPSLNESTPPRGARKDSKTAVEVPQSTVAVDHRGGRRS